MARKTREASTKEPPAARKEKPAATRGTSPESAPEAQKSGRRRRGKVRVGVIGLGMGRAHLAGYQSCPDCKIVAICDMDKGRLASAGDEFEVEERFTRIEEMLAMKDLEAVSVALPNYLHCPITVQALRAGKHVLCEKPMAMTVEEAETMVKTAGDLGKKLMIHFNYRFTPPAQALKRYVDGGDLGEIYFVRTGWHRRRGVPGMGSWFTNVKLSGGGPLIDLGVHRLDLALWLMGNPEPVEVFGQTFARFGPQMAEQQGLEYTVEDLACGLVKLANGAAIAVEVSWAGNSEKAEDMYTVLWGDRGGAEQRNVGEGYEPGLKLYRERFGVTEDVTPKRFPSAPEGPQAHFVHCIQNDTEPMASGRHGLQIQKILNGLYESARVGHSVAV